LASIGAEEIRRACRLASDSASFQRPKHRGFAHAPLADPTKTLARDNKQASQWLTIS